MRITPRKRCRGGGGGGGEALDFSSERCDRFLVSLCWIFGISCQEFNSFFFFPAKKRLAVTKFLCRTVSCAGYVP